MRYSGYMNQRKRSLRTVARDFLLATGPSLAVLVFVALVLGAILWATWDATGLPSVVREWPDGACLRVEYSDGRVGSCDALPARYETVWEEESP